MKDISIIIPTLNRENILIKTLHHINTIYQKDLFEVIVVVDKNSTHLNLKLSDFNYQLNVLHNSKSGAAANRNLGAQHASSPHLLFLDDDIILTDLAFISILNFKNKYPDSCLNPNWIYPENILNNLKTSPFGRFILDLKWINYKSWVLISNWNDNELFEVDKLSAFCLLISKENFNKVGGFNEEFKFQSVEDDELSVRLKQNGIKMYIDPRVFVYHNEIDRINLKNRLKRLQTGAYNKRMAYDMGLSEYKLEYPNTKLTILHILSAPPIQKILVNSGLFIEKLNARFLDKIYFKLVHILIAICIFNGYYKKKSNFL